MTDLEKKDTDWLKILKDTKNRFIKCWLKVNRLKDEET